MIDAVNRFSKGIQRKRKVGDLEVNDNSSDPATTYSNPSYQSPLATGSDVSGKQFGDNAILPGYLPFVSPQLTQAFLQYLLGSVGQGVSPYPGPTSYDINNTILPGVYGAYGNSNPAQSQLAALLNTPALKDPFGYKNPDLSTISQWGGPSGPGTQAQSYMMQYGTPSQAGQFESNLAQYGVASEGSGRPLVNQQQYGASGWGGLPLLDVAKTGTSGSSGDALQRVAQTGISGPGGQALANLASGQFSNPFSSLLMKFALGGQPYSAPLLKG